MRFFLYFASILLSAGFGPLAQAREDIVPGSFYTSAQSAAMGDAAAPLASDTASALFQNPAALAKLKGIQAEPLNLSLYGNTGLFSQVGTTPSAVYQATSLSSLVPSLQKNPGNFSGLGGAFLPNFYFKGIAFGLLAQSQLGAVANSNGTVSYRSLYQLIPTAGTGIKLASGIVRIGYSLQWVNQASGSVSGVNPGTTPLGFNQQLQQGSFFSHNIGFALTLPYQYLPQLNIVGRNLFNSGFNTRSLYSFTPSSTGAPTKDPSTIDVGLSFVNKLGGGNSVNFSAVDRDATNASGVTILGRMALGIEFDFFESVFLRAGWGSGYPTAGIGVKLATSEISFAWTSEEIGNGYHDDRDERYLVQFQFRAF
ncbi:MAG: hypothetical protein P4M08_11945 [Oligoflexia bacterium]|nr:hypothetical protein [Oligoflexia bacterium]